jgi:hypothetical protein
VSRATFVLALVVLLALLGSVYSSWHGALGMLTWDEAEYAGLGRSVLRGEGFALGGQPGTLRPPLLPLSAAASFALAGAPTDRAAKAAVLAWALVALGVVASVFAGAFDRATGLLAAAFLGCAPAFLEFVPRVLSEVPFVAAFTPALALAYAGLYRDARLLPWSWALLGISLLVRYTGVLFLPLFALLCAAAWAGGDPAVRRRMRSAWFLLSPLAALAVQAPWLLRQHLVTGDALSGFRYASGQLDAFLPDLVMPWYSYAAFLPQMLTWPVLVLAAVGVAWAVRERDRAGLHCVGAIAFVLLWFSFYRMKEIRMATSTLPFLCALAALGVTRGLVPRGAPRVYGAAAGLALAILLGSNLYKADRASPSRATVGYPAFLRAMEFLRSSTPPEARILGESGPQISWYADRTTRRVPSEPARFGEALAGADWLVIVNFERGQPAYVSELAERAGSEARLFDDGRFRTLLVPAASLRSAR